jgi:aminopeptidase N
MDAPDLQPTPNPAREVIDTQLTFDVAAKSGTATITFGPSTEDGATLEVGDLMIDSTSVANARNAKQLDLALPASSESSTVEIAFHYVNHSNFDGAANAGWTLVWPYYCGNLFPCHSDPADGTTFGLTVNGVPSDQTAIYPTMLAEAPSYQIAWAIGDYTEIPLGTTTAGTQVSVWHQDMETDAMTGTQNLVAAFDWYEQTIGPYRFGNKVGPVPVTWGPGALGGMEHHPYWHVALGALKDQDTNAHEAAHGWYGDGIRIQCWEDFVLSEGTVSYLSARSLSVVAPAVGDAIFQSYVDELPDIAGTDPVWPQSCGSVDILDDNLFTRAPYVRGALFYKAVADKTTPELVDQALHEFYMEHAGGSATMQQMLDKLTAVTGYDVTTCADMWLESTTKPAPGPCP